MTDIPIEDMTSDRARSALLKARADLLLAWLCMLARASAGRLVLPQCLDHRVRPC